MGSSIYWYRVDAQSFKNYLKADDAFDKYQQELYERELYTMFHPPQFCKFS